MKMLHTLRPGTKALALMLGIIWVSALLTIPSTSTFHLPPVMAASPHQESQLPNGFTQTLVASNFGGFPTCMAIAPDGRIFICLQNGTVRLVKNGSLLPDPVVTLSVHSISETGLIGIALDPQFTTNQFIYLHYTATSPTLHNRVSRFTLDGDTILSGSEVILLELPTLTYNIHNGGELNFGHDGKLYIGVGDNALSVFAQGLSTPFGKILRINPDGSIPPDNPFFEITTGVNQAIWAYGLRNPFSFAFQPGKGPMYINDVGQDLWEEINLGKAGANYGWPVTEGPTTEPSFTTPVLAYPHGEGLTAGCSIVGAAFYNPTTVRFPSQYVGRFFFGDLCNGWIASLTPQGQFTHFQSGFIYPVDVAVSADGFLYVLAEGGTSGALYQIDNANYGIVEIIQPPVNQYAGVGQTATFTVAASGIDLTYQWQRNGVNITGATGSSYTTPPVRTQDNGAQFRCRVSNQLNAVTSTSATLTVLATPKTVSSIADAYVRNGSNANRNFGTAPTLIVEQSASTSSIQYTYVRFDSRAIQTPIASAKLRIFGNLSSSLQRNVPLAIYPVSDTTWRETSITWNTRPPAGTTPITNVTIRDLNSRWYEVDISPYVLSELQAGRRVFSFMIANTAPAKVFSQFNSRQNASSGPQLVVITQ